ncbi:MAG: substrate-binding domain-containing protein [Sediminibacterium sp.]|nr:substrate-binding domain-containing protein [Sediminibacterium sp.]MBP6144282.1 substrate-binding domain-containing protein [Sediminibacterium sp.]
MRSFILGFVSLLLFVSCKNTPETMQDSPNQGLIRISVEESFKPFMEEQLKVFLASNPKAEIIASYKSEIDCFKDLANDSTRMIFVTRGLNKQEQIEYKKSLSFNPNFAILAYNAVAVLVHKSATDTVFSLKELGDRLTGKSDQQVVMDGNHLTGIIRFLKDSLAKDAPLGKNVVAANGSKEVIDYIATHPGAIGFVGMNWIGDGYDPAQIELRKKVKLGLVECTQCIEKGYFSKPSPATISKAQYPLTLPIYFILKENAAGLGTGFLNFLSLERGQLIFKRSFLVPAKMGFKKRNSLLE